MPHRTNRKDGNHHVIVEKLRAKGYSVYTLHVFADIMVGYAKLNFLFEVKDPKQPPSKRILTPAEAAFRETWQGQIHTILYAEQAIEVIEMAVRQQKRQGER